MIIAIDGPAASGKGTLARKLADHCGFAYLDTGKLYRAVGMKVLRTGGDPEDEDAARDAAGALDAAELEDDALHREEAANAASQVAAMAPVREALLAFQRRYAAEPPNGARGAVLDGRDIGTVVCPDADVKLFVTADVAVRAERRHKELLDRGVPSIYARVLADLKERDARDTNRSTAPMRPADDATVIDTSEMDPREALRAALDAVEAVRADRGEAETGEADGVPVGLAAGWPGHGRHPASAGRISGGRRGPARRRTRPSPTTRIGAPMHRPGKGGFGARAHHELGVRPPEPTGRPG